MWVRVSLLSAGAVSLACVLACGGAGSTTSTPADPGPRDYQASELYSIGERVAVEDHQREKAWLYKSEDDYANIRTQNATLLEPGTRVRVVEIKAVGQYVTVEVEDGPKKGSRGILDLIPLGYSKRVDAKQSGAK